MAIVVLLLWFATAAAGLTLLRAGGAARRAAAPSPPAAAPVRIGAAPLTAEGKAPPIVYARVTPAATDHTLLEFSHPALAITGIAFWMMFTLVHYRPMAWIALAVLLVTIGMGLTWLARSGRAQKTQAPGRRFPARLAGLHGLAASLTILVGLLAALVASR